MTARGVFSERLDGGEPVLVFLHEALGSVSQWKDFPAALCARTGRAGFVYDRPGHGRSGPLAGPRGKEYLRDEALEGLPRTLEAAGIGGRVVLVGHSDGGTIALLYAAARPERVAGVISEAAHVFNDDFTRAGVRSTVEAARDGALLKRLERHHGGKTDALFRAWHETWLSPWFRDWDVRPLLGKVTAPVLVVQGLDDKYGTSAQVEAIARGVRRAEVLMVPACGHAPHHERREAVLERMAAFVAALAP